MCPNDPDATKKLKECEKAVMKLKFEEAISVPESERRSIAESIDFHTIGTILNMVSYASIFVLSYFLCASLPMWAAFFIVKFLCRVSFFFHAVMLLYVLNFCLFWICVYIKGTYAALILWTSNDITWKSSCSFVLIIWKFSTMSPVMNIYWS